MPYVEKTHRFGLLTPSSNTVQEPEFSAALPAAVSLHTARVAYRDITPQEQMRCVRELENECRKLADAEVDVVVFAATAPTLANGKGYDRELIAPGALLAALGKGRPGYAAVDVYEHEPVGDHPFLSMPNVLCTPHLGWAEWENFELYFREAFEQIVAYERGLPLRLANPQVR